MKFKLHTSPPKFGQVVINTPFPHTVVASSIELEDGIIVLYQDANGGYTQRVPTCNVVSFNLNGYPNWVIQPITPLETPEADHFVEIGINSVNGRLQAKTKSGRTFDVDLKSGQLIVS